jgi:uncharacterized protein YegP (UPF0339 family)
MKNFFFIFVLFIFLGCEAVFVEDISNETVVVLAPTENSDVAAGNVTFNWQLVFEADSYQVQIAAPSFQNATQILLDSVSESNVIQKNLEAGAYEWRIRALNSEYQTDYITVGFTVSDESMVDDISAETVVILAPNQSAQVDAGDIDFTWDLLDGVDSYQIQIATPSFQNASQILLDSITESNTIQFNLAAGAYEWRIKGINSEYETNYSTVSFTVN